uniref:protein lifeguard 2-like isoform X7 n=1 Tax=Doryrhamphus excisus TaxID=161450 RepID=UPI0025AE4F91|nr:protein lifeguard 2-like isoform X7 [Doryrhamphus excisus]XP_057940419.1 protein lifeguard 2-like isoform X7 [Doryrhamphus excisus]
MVLGFLRCLFRDVFDSVLLLSTKVKVPPSWQRLTSKHKLIISSFQMLKSLFCHFYRRRFPWNLILLAIFTLSLIYMTGMLSRYWFLLPLISQKVSDFALNLSNQFMNSNLLLFSVYSRYIVYCRQSFYNTKSVMICLGITTAVCLLVTILSFQTKVDVTSYQGVLLIFCMVMFISGLVLAAVLPFLYVPWLDTTYAVLGAILFTMFLAFDTQLLMGNKRYTMSPEEYIFATLSIYLDIVYIFSFFLQIFGTRQE